MRLTEMGRCPSTSLERREVCIYWRRTRSIATSELSQRSTLAIEFDGVGGQT